MKKFSFFFFINIIIFIAHSNAYVDDLTVPANWVILKPILIHRMKQTSPKMKLSYQEVNYFVNFLKNLNTPTPELISLKDTLPKTTLELLMAVYSRGLDLNEAEKMASYLYNLLLKFKFENPGAFDENTSHIIGREWYEINYSGENMTWQKQREKYLPYGILNFKSVEYLTKFFFIESSLPYFRKIYRPKNPSVLKIIK